MKSHNNNPEKERLSTTPTNTGWKKWGPYLSERQWGTVREDYSEHGYAWGYLTHDMARSKAYRWGEDGIAGLSDTKQTICFALALWNGRDAIIKERLFGLNNGEGNHGEDVKEYYYYLDSTPTHSYMKMLYKYPQNAFPYSKLVEENHRRSRLQSEYELIETGIFDNDEYFDVYVEYAKASEEDILIKITVHNRNRQEVMLNVLPTIWFRNTWSWGYESWEWKYKPQMYASEDKDNAIVVKHKNIGNFKLYYENDKKEAFQIVPELLFCDNETNPRRLPHLANINYTKATYFKDGIHDYLILGDKKTINPELKGTKASIRYLLKVSGHGSATVKLRLSNKEHQQPFAAFDEIFANRLKEADIFYDELSKNVTEPDMKRVLRQAYAGMLWNKQYYYYNVNQWLKGDPAMPPVPKERSRGRNHKWKHLYNSNLISMPDKWEYPWYAAWDLAFHCVPLARLDPHFAKRQLVLMLREYYMHPNGQLPAYEWHFSDVNPPVHAWGAWKVYNIEKQMNNGKGDTDFLATVFHKLLMNFTWWVNQKDAEGNNLFEGGFLGLDNIGVFDRSNSLPTGGYMEQADGTSWMAMYCLNMLRISLELAQEKPYYQETASKFFEHFLSIASAMFNMGKEHIDLWDEEDEFYYDILHPPNGMSHRLKVRSIVGIIPLFAVEVLTPELLEKLPDFTRRLDWVLKNRPDLASLISRWYELGRGESRLLSLLRIHRMKCVLRRMLDEAEFLSEYGIRSLSKHHLEKPYQYYANGRTYSVSYLPGESDSSMFGGNSNWRGPIWFPINYLIIESLQKFHEYYGDMQKFEYPTGSGKMFTLKEIAQMLTDRLIKIFVQDEQGTRVVFGEYEKMKKDPHFKDNILFYEYFNGDTGKGLGASHQTGWTGLIASLIEGY
ncbi:MGH1-like glycoside hydrolase domain-containing protein [Thermoflexibacter ruber]|uniref:Glycosyl hydrolase family 63 C-terminal domain-containing protein n=1 Tax=Thermoflexibacter ruber TaxID=1003 RepID=A0A1I2H9K1_9BACT|nr:glucosidase [Thermoflexibacter ruber]SFF26149.1 Glycosyl hydrolase family 63 C-terminal domain-containing protein [Thermoflexibacter ruber]